MSVSVKPERRSHASRSAETRGKILDAVVECIAELGLKKTTTNAIAERAGVTWGALQHHFGGLDGCLIAAFNDSFRRFEETLGEPPDDGLPLEKRVEIFVDRSWQHYRSPHYISMFQLLLNDMSTIDDEQWQQSKASLVKAMDNVWKRFFQASVPDAETRWMLVRYTHSVLTGLAVSSSHGWGDEKMQSELEMLKKSLQERIVDN